MSDNQNRDANVIDYLQHCVSENLSHARHVENERLTFTSIYIAMVVGAVAVVFGLENNWVAAIVSLALSAFSLMAFQLNARWQGVFDEHMHKAEACQALWRKAIQYPEGVSLTDNDYCYSYRAKPKTRKEKRLWMLGYSMLDKPETYRFSDLFKRTRHLFALLFLAVALLLSALTLYLVIKAILSPTGQGFYFTDEAIADLKNLLTHVLEEANK